MTMAEGDLSAGLLNAMNPAADDASQTAGAETNPSAEGAPQATPAHDFDGLSGYAQNFLAKIPDNLKGEAAKWVREWDTGFQQHARTTAEKYKPYEQLGSVEDLRIAVQVMNQLKTDTNGFVKELMDMGYGKAHAQQLVQQAGGAPPEDPYAGLNPQVAAQLKEFNDFKAKQEAWALRMETAVGGVATMNQQQMQAAQQAQADAALDSMLQQAEQKHGPYDKLWVMNKMYTDGVTADAAVQAFKSMISGYSQKPATRVVPSTSMPAPAPGSLDTSEGRAAALIAHLSQG